jgi:hypothetical protein
MARQVALVGEANVNGNAGNGLSSQQEPFGPLHPQLGEIGMGWQAIGRFEEAQQMVGAEMNLRRQFI